MGSNPGLPEAILHFVSSSNTCHLTKRAASRSPIRIRLLRRPGRLPLMVFRHERQEDFITIVDPDSSQAQRIAGRWHTRLNVI
jgi:hypothetical protein